MSDQSIEEKLSKLSAEELHLIGDEPISDAGRVFLAKLSGADTPHKNLEEVYASVDPYSLDAEAAFQAEQAKEDE